MALSLIDGCIRSDNYSKKLETDKYISGGSWALLAITNSMDFELLVSKEVEKSNKYRTTKVVLTKLSSTDELVNTSEQHWGRCESVLFISWLNIFASSELSTLLWLSV